MHLWISLMNSMREDLQQSQQAKRKGTSQRLFHSQVGFSPGMQGWFERLVQHMESGLWSAVELVRYLRVMDLSSNHRTHEKRSGIVVHVSCPTARGLDTDRSSGLLYHFPLYSAYNDSFLLFWQSSGWREFSFICYMIILPATFQWSMWQPGVT